MTTIQQLQAAAKKAPHYRVTCGALEVMGSPGATRWSFNYLIKKTAETRGAYGKQNAVDYLAKIAPDMPIENVTFPSSKIETLIFEAQAIDGAAHKARIVRTASGGIELRLYEAARENEQGRIGYVMTERYWNRMEFDSLSSAIRECAQTLSLTLHEVYSHLSADDMRTLQSECDTPRGFMVHMSRVRSAHLRTRAWSENALDVRAFHAFALTCDKDGNRIVEKAADYTQTTIILWRSYGGSSSSIRTARAVFHDSYALARQGRLVETVRLNRR
jgi:hypothetical protein